MGKKTPFLYVIVSNTSKGHSGRQTTPIDPCQRAFKGLNFDLFLKDFSQSNFTVQICFSKTFQKLSASPSQIRTRIDPNHSNSVSKVQITLTFANESIFHVFHAANLDLFKINSSPFNHRKRFPAIHC
jgi:hypothetical protein